MIGADCFPFTWSAVLWVGGAAWSAVLWVGGAAFLLPQLAFTGLITAKGGVPVLVIFWF